MKGIEGLPLKYIAAMLIAAIVIYTFVNMTNIISAFTTNSANTSTDTLRMFLNNTVGNALTPTPSP